MMKISIQINYFKRMKISEERTRTAEQFFTSSKCFIFGSFQLGFFKEMVLSSQHFSKKAYDQNFFFYIFFSKLGDFFHQILTAPVV